MNPGRSGTPERAAPRAAKGRVGPEGRNQERAEGRTGFKAAALGFGLMTVVVTGAATGLFILLDPRAQAFWGTTYADLAALLRGVVRGVVER